jgi:hypothetical protein
MRPYLQSAFLCWSRHCVTTFDTLCLKISLCLLDLVSFIFFSGGGREVEKRGGGECVSGDVREVVVVVGEWGGERGGVEGPGRGEESGFGEGKGDGECCCCWWWWYLVEGRGGVEGGGRVKGGVWGEGRGDL